MKKSMFALISSIAVLGTALAGCGGGQQAAQTTSEPAASGQAQGNAQPAPAEKSSGSQVLRWNLHSEPPTGDPGLAEDTTSAAIVKALFDGLTRIGPSGKPEEAVAEKIEVSPDLKTYTFKLRDSHWSNGDPVTAHDFEYAWKRALDPKTASNYAYQLYYIKNAEKANKGNGSLDEVGVKALDDKTLQVELANPTPFFLELTAFQTYFPVNKKVVESADNWAGDAKTHIGNGPFKMESWEHKNKMVLVKNDHYWDKDSVKLDKIEFSMVEDENTELSMFENGEIDWAGAPLSSLPIDAMPVLKDSGKLQVKPVGATYWYKFNTEKPPFNNVKIRKAFAYSINRQTLIDNVLQANQQPAMGAVPPTMALNPDGYFKDNDQEAAKKLLEEGMKELGLSKLPPITLVYNTSEGHKKIAEAIQDQWRKYLGVEVKLENQEWKVYLETMHEGNYQVGRLGWSGDFNDPINFLELFKEKDGGNNDTRWENPKFKELLNQSATEKDPEKRKAILREAEQILMDEMPIVPIYFYTHTWVKNDKVKGVFQDGLGAIDWKWTSVE
ncbi:peptide ABC transporter substrate-binding protein [Brevibacillus agri]|uniref:peptide ABC transporter substrate-binding protein n=1 Tax=Brevibacillus TaxID=55080 RepID=UPI0002A4F90B|nr:MULTISPECIES: peptide ABC transporter substrate-binding protein [Brevibacillus]ELK40034.1 oligopeptide ABC transporter substrate-binding protein [Brevibacillus agri BAB-2500]MBG9564446.1 ABC transporter substrate-binding protein [Brevibacillus agri]MCG5254623.1 peptide ABC transporter substrate-binding protein [Brevibacillus agri]MED1642972.1 peptide ABC transporter substrate-binding protein [Brevibacillus agri]MED1656543.1 peptide ABC transporter substrate-binding protein [Brevibacillus ag